MALPLVAIHIFLSIVPCKVGRFGLLGDRCESLQGLFERRPSDGFAEEHIHARIHTLLDVAFF